MQIVGKTMAMMAAVTLVTPLWTLAVADAATDKKAPPPSIEVRLGKKRIGVEVIRSKSGDANRYHSTSVDLRDNGRSFKQRSHVVLDANNRLVTYDRWIDVKGATIRIRVFSIEGVWKQVLFGQPGEKNKVTELGIKGAPVVFDERSPMINGLAPVLATKRASVPCIRVDAGRAAECKIKREALVDGAGAAFVRTTFGDEKFSVEVIRNATGLTVWTKGPGEYFGAAPGFSAANLHPAEDKAVVDVEPPVEAESDAPLPPPSDDPEGHVIARPAPAAPPAKPPRPAPTPQAPPADAPTP